MASVLGSKPVGRVAVGVVGNDRQLLNGVEPALPVLDRSPEITVSHVVQVAASRPTARLAPGNMEDHWPVCSSQRQ